MTKAATASLLFLLGVGLACWPGSFQPDSNAARSPAPFDVVEVREPTHQLGQGRDLFNGLDLTGWQHLGGGRALIQDGMLVLENDRERRPGYLMSDFVAKDFIVQFRCRVEAGDTGLIFRGRRQPRTPSELMGPQVQLNLDPARGLGGVYELHNRGWLRKPDPALVGRLLREDGWINGELLARGNEIRVTINGATTVRFVDDAFGNFFAGPGCFGLQIHGGGPCRVRWASLTVQALPSGFDPGEGE